MQTPHGNTPATTPTACERIRAAREGRNPPAQLWRASGPLSPRRRRRWTKGAAALFALVAVGTAGAWVGGGGSGVGYGHVGEARGAFTCSLAADAATGAPGSQAAATYDCSNGFHFQIPRGDVGATGATGAVGPAGPAGANGTNGTNGVSVTSQAEPAGANCAAAGVKYTDVANTRYVCNGAAGTNGTNGVTGYEVVTRTLSKTVIASTSPVEFTTNATCASDPLTNTNAGCAAGQTALACPAGKSPLGAPWLGDVTSGPSYSSTVPLVRWERLTSAGAFTIVLQTSGTAGAKSVVVSFACATVTP